MLRLLFRLIVLALVVGGVAYPLGYWDGGANRRIRAAAGALEGRIDRERIREAGADIADSIAEGAGRAGDALAEAIDRERIREAGAEIAGRIGQGAGRAETVLTEARLTTKIKAKMALDDTIRASRLDVDTHGSVVTVSGTVETAAERDRALQLARETDGVTSVVDRIVVEAP